MSRTCRLCNAAFAASLLALVLAGSGVAQDAGTVTGTMVDLQTGQPIGGVKSGVTRFCSLDFGDPAGIDRIEVLRGPATAFRFGLSGPAGAIPILAKRGGGV